MARKVLTARVVQQALIHKATVVGHGQWLSKRVVFVSYSNRRQDQFALTFKHNGLFWISRCNLFCGRARVCSWVRIACGWLVFAVFFAQFRPASQTL